MVNPAGYDVRAKLLTLDSTTHDMILSCLDGHHLAQLSNFNREWRGIIQGFYRRAYNITQFLLPYFQDAHKPNLVDEFRFMQSQTGALISGSAALQFFARTTYAGSDLDLYVEHRRVEDVIAFLEYAGYRYERRAGQHANLPQQIRERPHALTEEEEYHQTGCRDVYDFMKGERKVQIVTTEDNPMNLILNFHSTVVMNVISHLNAFALYPKATFKHKFAVSTVRHSSEELYEAALAKYRERGWDIRSVENSHDIGHTLYSSRGCPPALLEFTRAIRCVGDAKTWTIPLPAPRVVGEGYIPEEVLHAHTWRPSNYATQLSSLWEANPAYDSDDEDSDEPPGKYVQVYREDLKMEFETVKQHNFEHSFYRNTGTGIPIDFCICRADSSAYTNSLLTMQEFNRRFRKDYTGSQESLLSELSKATLALVGDLSSDLYKPPRRG